MEHRVLIVDRNGKSRARAAAALREAGLRVVGEAASARQAVQLANEHKPTVVVLDVDLSDMPPADASQAIREAAGVDVAVVAIAADEDAERLGELVPAGASAFVLKGEIDDLVSSVSSAPNDVGTLSPRAKRPVLEEVARLYEREKNRTAELQRMVDQLQSLSVTDWLTGLKNHGYFYERLTQELERARRYGRPVALLLADVDDFRTVNDSYGFAAGDVVLRTVGEIFLSGLRSSDVACRTGGEEFALVMPETGAVGAAVVAERIRRSVSERTIPDVGKVTISIGVGIYPEHALGREELIEATERALYVAKRSGKDRIKLAGELNTVSIETRTQERNATPVAKALLGALRLRDPNRADHSMRVAVHATAIGTALGLRVVEIERLRLAALLHDVGMLGVSDPVIFKPEPLSEVEWAAVRRHPEAGLVLVQEIVPEDVAQAVVTHHENYDGSGYPSGVSGDDIPLFGRILRVADAYDAMTTERPYQLPLTPDEAIAEMRHTAAAQFDPMCVDAFAGAALQRGWIEADPDAEIIEFPGAARSG